MEQKAKLSGSISVAMKVNLGNYESADCLINISGITEDTTDAEILTLLDGRVKVSYDALKYRIKERVIDLRKSWLDKTSK